MFIIIKSERRAVTDAQQQHREVAMKTDMQMCPYEQRACINVQRHENRDQLQ